MSQHECIAKINDLLAKHNTQLTEFITFTDAEKLSAQSIGIMTSKIDEKKRGKPMLLFANYCPMCGVKL